MPPLSRFAGRLLALTYGPLLAGAVTAAAVLLGQRIDDPVDWLVTCLLLLPVAHVHLHGRGDEVGVLDTLAITVAASAVALLLTVAGVYAGAVATMLLAFAIQTGALGQICAALSLALALRATAGQQQGLAGAVVNVLSGWRLTCGGILPILSASPNP